MIAANVLKTATFVATVWKPPVLRNSTYAIRATAPPPTPLKSATICGICVIFTMRAAGMATAVPNATPRRISQMLPMLGRSSVATMAIAMPTAARRFPRTAVLGPVRPDRP